jgi:hypothetical protein
MDVIVIGKESLKSNCKPQVVYCGQSGSEARDAVAATGGKFEWVYQVNSLPIRNYKSTDFNPPKAAEVAAEVAPVVAEVAPEPVKESPKKKNSK